MLAAIFFSSHCNNKWHFMIKYVISTFSPVDNFWIVRQFLLPKQTKINKLLEDILPELRILLTIKTTISSSLFISVFFFFLYFLSLKSPQLPLSERVWCYIRMCAPHWSTVVTAHRNNRTPSLAHSQFPTSDKEKNNTLHLLKPNIYLVGTFLQINILN